MHTAFTFRETVTIKESAIADIFQMKEIHILEQLHSIDNLTVYWDILLSNCIFSFCFILKCDVIFLCFFLLLF